MVMFICWYLFVSCIISMIALYRRNLDYTIKEMISMLLLFPIALIIAIIGRIYDGFKKGIK